MPLPQIENQERNETDLDMKITGITDARYPVRISKAIDE